MMKIISKQEIEETKKITPWLREDLTVDYIKHDLAEDAPDEIKEIYARWKAEGKISNEQE